MNEHSKKNLVAYSYTLLLVTLLCLIIGAVHFLVTPYYKANLRNSVAKTIAGISNPPLVPGSETDLRGNGISRITAWKVEGKNRGGELIVAVPVTGDSGPYTAVFHYKNDNDVRFLALAGIPESSLDPVRFGFSERLLQFRIQKLKHDLLELKDAK